MEVAPCISYGTFPIELVYMMDMTLSLDFCIATSSHGAKLKMLCVASPASVVLMPRALTRARCPHGRSYLSLPAHNNSIRTGP